MAHLYLGVAAVMLGATALGLAAWLRHRPGPTRRPSPLRRAELDALLAAEYGGPQHDQDRDPADHRVILTGPATLPEASWQHTVTLVEHALDQALLQADGLGTYCAAGLRSTAITPSDHTLTWWLPGPVAETVVRLLPRHLPPELVDWLHTETPAQL